MKKYLIILLAIMSFSVTAIAQIKDSCINVW